MTHKKAEEDLMKEIQERREFSARLNALLDAKEFAPKGQGRQTQLAKMFDVEPESARKWLEAESIPRQHRIRAICKEFGAREDWLRFGNPPMLVKDETSYDQRMARLDPDDRAAVDRFLEALESKGKRS